MMKVALLTLFTFVLMMFLPAKVQASVIGASCPNVGGEVIANFPTGQHQILGGGLLSGSDTVFKVNDNLFIQCFCPDSGGSGIQTTFIKTDTSPGPGWTQVNGSDWGLPAGTFFARNSSFACCAQGCPCNTTTSVTISGNGADSHNSVSVDVNKQMTVSQNNNSQISNSITAKQNTGDNKTNKNTNANTSIVTGTSFSSMMVSNKVNFSWTSLGF